MMITAMIILALTIAGGMYLLSYVLEGKHTPKGVALIHGGAGVAGVLVLIGAAFYDYRLFYIVGVFVLAACGGIVLFMHDIYGKKIPKILAVGHGLVAIAGFSALLLYFLSRV